MVLEKMISEDTVKLGIPSDTDKWTVIEQLVDVVVERGLGSDRDKIMSAVMDREGQASTGLENGIAIPHARTDYVSEFACAIGISENGIDFDSADGNLCHVVFLVVAPNRDSASYLKALSTIAAIGSDSEKVTRLKGARSPAEVISLLEEPVAEEA